MTDPLTILPGTWRGLGATIITGPRLRVVVTTIGAHVASIRSPRTAIEPLWQPPWAAVAPESAGPAHGGEAERRLLATIVGSNLCLDRFGAPWPGESRPLHGEAGAVCWRCRAEPCRAVFTARLPEAGLDVERAISLIGDEVVLATTVRHAGAAPRAVEWCEHTTLGGGFLDGALATAGVDAAWTAPWPEDPLQRVPGAPLTRCAPAAALAIPQPGDRPCGDVMTARTAAGWWRVANPRLGWAFSAAFNPEEFPWLALWTEFHGRTGAPWNGLGRTRGMELSTKPFPEGQPPAERAQVFADRPTRCLVPAGAGRTHTVRFRWAPL